MMWNLSAVLGVWVPGQRECQPGCRTDLLLVADLPAVRAREVALPLTPVLVASELARCGTPARPAGLLRCRRSRGCDGGECGGCGCDQDGIGRVGREGGRPERQAVVGRKGLERHLSRYVIAHNDGPDAGLAIADQIGVAEGRIWLAAVGLGQQIRDLVPVLQRGCEARGLLVSE